MNDTQTRPIQAPASQGTIVEQSRAVAEVAAAVSVAQANPRSESGARAVMLENCGRLSVANRAFYEVPNRGAGPSIHLARELARIWGNVDYGVRELSRDDDAGESEMQVWAWDQQTNSRSTRSFIAPHARMKRGNRERLTDIGDIYLSNQNVGARAVRECIFAVLPGWFVAEAEQKCKDTLRNGDGRPFSDRVQDAVDKFAELKVAEKQLEARLDAKRDKWTPSHLTQLIRIYTSVTIDGIPAAEYFPDQVIDLTALPTAQADPAHPDYVAAEGDK